MCSFTALFTGCPQVILRFVHIVHSFVPRLLVVHRLFTGLWILWGVCPQVVHRVPVDKELHAHARVRAYTRACGSSPNPWDVGSCLLVFVH